KEYPSIQLSYPISRDGGGWDIEGIKKIFQWVFERELKIDPKEHPILIDDTLKGDYRFGDVLAILFQVFEIPYIFVLPSPLLSALFLKKEKGTSFIVEFRSKIIDFAPIWEGKLQNRYGLSAYYGLADIADVLKWKLPLHKKRNIENTIIYMWLEEWLINNSFFIYNSPGSRLRSLDQIKLRFSEANDPYLDEQEKREIIGPNILPESKNSENSTSHERIDLKFLRWSVVDEFFEPLFLYSKEDGMLRDHMFWAIASCEPYMREKLCNNIILTGRLPKIPGFAQLLKEKLMEYLPRDLATIPTYKMGPTNWYSKFPYDKGPEISSVDLLVPEIENLEWKGGLYFLQNINFSSKLQDISDFSGLSYWIENTERTINQLANGSIETLRSQCLHSYESLIEILDWTR
ncbi:MAG: hypothetical protein ACFFCS_24265, partial [Candidatus Hodarchaeota archaeon]